MPTIYNKVVLDGTTLIDISDTTATASDVAQGKYFYTTAGVKTEGTASGSSGTPTISVVDTLDSHGGTIRTITAVDISDTTAIASDVASGKYFYTANGTKTLGTSSGGGSTPTLITKSITTNGTYTASNDSADGYSSVTVNVPSSGITPTGSINITTNGTHDVTNYASAVVNVSGGGGSSATQHVIHLEFSDETNANVNVYYDDTAFSSIITSSKPTTYNTKTIESASLDGVQWYIRETWEVVYENDSTGVNADTPYNYFWISSLSDVYPTINSVWRITIDSIEYRCTATALDNKIIVGNLKYEGGEDDNTGVPFDFYNAGWGAWVGNTELAPAPHVVKIERLVV